MSANDTSTPNTSMPSPAFGTMPTGPAEEMYDRVKMALEQGYRHFDLAERYEGQEHVGRAIRDAELKREDLWLTSKLDGMPTGDYEAVVERVQGMLQAIGQEFFDLLLIHFPVATSPNLDGDPAPLSSPETWAEFEAHVEESWGILARLQKEGLCRHIGVSNFYPQHMAVLLPVAERLEAPVFANEIFMDLAHMETAFVADMSSKSISVLGYRPFAFLPNYAILEHVQSALDAAVEASESNSAPDLCVRLLGGAGVIPVVSTTSANHAASNLAAVQRPLEANAKGVGDLLQCLQENEEMLGMVGAADEYASAFKACVSVP